MPIAFEMHLSVPFAHGRRGLVKIGFSILNGLDIGNVLQLGYNSLLIAIS